jgi:hypothetical protein
MVDLEVLEYLNSDLRIATPTVRLFSPYDFSVTAGAGTCSKLFNKQTKKLTEPLAALVPSLMFTYYLKSHAAGMVWAASGKNISPQFRNLAL